MPIDPSIIGNVMAPAAPQLPDVNAMLETQTRGAENIYKIERQRQADAAAAQEKATADQEAATIKALLPAYTYLIQTGNVAGVSSLVPPDMLETVQPYIDALAGKPPEEVKAAAIGSLSSSAMGQEALAAIQRAGTLSVQQGQLAVSREDIALRRQKQALDAQGQGEWELKEGEGGFFWTNPRTREVVPADVTGGAVPSATPGAVPAPSLVMPRQPAPGAPAVAPPISAAPPPSEFRPKPKETGGKSKDLTEGEAKSLDFAAQMAQANKITDELDAKGVRTSDALVSFTESLFAALPDAAGKNLADQVRTAAENLLPTLSAEEQRLARAQLQFVDAVLRSRSGAEIKTSEFPSMYRVFFPTEADENIPEIVADKKIARQLAVDTMRAKAGTLGAETLDRLLRENGVLPPATDTSGFEYLGVEE